MTKQPVITKIKSKRKISKLCFVHCATSVPRRRERAHVKCSTSQCSIAKARYNQLTMAQLVSSFVRRRQFSVLLQQFLTAQHQEAKKCSGYNCQCIVLCSECLSKESAANHGWLALLLNKVLYLNCPINKIFCFSLPCIGVSESNKC